MSDEPVLPPDQDPEVMVEYVKAFLKVGQFTWTDWLGLDDESRANVIEASEQLEAERAAMIGIASSGIDGAARIYSRVDQGDTVVSQALARVVSRSARR